MKRKTLLKITLISLGVLVVVLIVGREAGWIGSPEGERVTVEEVGRRSIVEVIMASGKVQPVIEVKISPDVSGEIIELPVREGAFVRKGDLLARINPDLYESALDRVTAALNTSRAFLASARARASQADARFISARANYTRNQRLFEQQAISEADYDAARAEFLVAQAEVEAARQSIVAAEFEVKSAEAGVTEARESLAKTSIFAPMDGTISRLDAEIGERVVGTSQFAGTEIMRIANLNHMEVLVEVNENDIIRINENDTAVIEIDAFRGRQFTGIVASIANSARVTEQGMDQVTNFEVKIHILPDSYKDLIFADRPHLSPFRPGMSATTEIRTRRAVDVLSVPIQAVTTRQNAGGSQDTLDVAEEPQVSVQEYVFLYKEGKTVLQKVTSGIQDTRFIEIAEGLEPGMMVITGPFRAVSQELSDGDAVIKTSRQELFGEN